MKPDMSTNHTSDLEVRDFNDLQKGFELSSNFVQKNYLSELTNFEIVPLPDEIKEITVRNHIRMFKVSKLVYDKKEDTLDKLASVYNALTHVNGSLVMVIDSNGNEASLYLGVKTIPGTNNINSVKEALEKSFTGHFQGTEIENLKNPQIEHLLSNMVQPKSHRNPLTVSAVSGIPSLKDQEKNSFVQGLEKLMDAMKGEAFSAIFLADPIEHRNLEAIKTGYENLYSQLVPFANCELSFNSSDSQAITDGLTTGFTEAINESVSKTQSHTSSTSETEGSSTSTGKTKSLATAGGAMAGFLLGGPGGAMLGAAIGAGLGGSDTTNTSSNYSKTTNESSTSGTSETRGSSHSNSTSEMNSETLTTGRSRNLQLSFENKAVTNLLEQVDEQLERLKRSADFGMWNMASYFIAPSQQTAQVAASTYKAIMRGENSALESSFINTWTPEGPEGETKLLEVGKYLSKLSHPLINLKVSNGLELPYVTPGSLLSGRELAISCSLPKKSISGLPVMETAEFGRNVLSYSGSTTNAFRLGQIFHMGQVENTPVELDVQSMSMHTFVTGSTGAGKSNTIYHLLQELNRKRVKFLVIEPAKGEYKEVFGGRKNVHVFGTNPAYTKLLKINPFRFPVEVHILEHIDRLVEMFNASWPMYAAMPAVLKDSIEQTYEKVGWDLENSINLSEDIVFPTFKDLLEVLPQVINQSSYSEELKGNYTGALETRVRSLTNGLIGRIFTDDEVDNELLFDENCIVDISRIGSAETKSLIMGILFMRLQEHRQATADGMNCPLKHVTVLEEAHHLLRRTSFDQNQEGSNVQGKSVEMISNAIAEMRTYGEGFIIADQAPNLLDQSVIRNTNTKIILRLPDGSDRSEVGRSASLNEDQINEIPKLKTGVAVVYQNNWLQPILCAVEPFEGGVPYKHQQPTLVDNKKKLSQLLSVLVYPRIPVKEQVDLTTIDVDGLITWLKGSHFSKSLKDVVVCEMNYFGKFGTLPLWETGNYDNLGKVVSELVNGEKLFDFSRTGVGLSDWKSKMMTGLRKYVDFNASSSYENTILQCILHDKARQDELYEKLYFSWVEKEKLEGSVPIL